jgi:hypothetical protein
MGEWLEVFHIFLKSSVPNEKVYGRSTGSEKYSDHLQETQTIQIIYFVVDSIKWVLWAGLKNKFGPKWLIQKKLKSKLTKMLKYVIFFIFSILNKGPVQWLTKKWWSFKVPVGFAKDASLGWPHYPAKRDLWIIGDSHLYDKCDGRILSFCYCIYDRLDQQNLSRLNLIELL